MVNLPIGWRKREKSSTFSGHSTILNRCHTMFRSISNRSSHRVNNELHASTTQRHKSIDIFRNHQSIKKAFSLILSKCDSAICNHPNDNEMHEFIRRASSEENLNTISRSTPNISHNTIINQPSLLSHSACMHHKFSHWKNKFICRHEHTDDNEKNNGYLVIINPNSEPVLLPNDNIDHQQTQHAQPCVQINEDSFDLNQIQYSLITTMSPNLSPPQRTSLVPYVSNYELEVQSTRSSVECGVPQADSLSIHNIQMSEMVSITSPSSTNSLNHEYPEIDRSMLNDNEYIRAQELDLYRLIDAEIDLSKERDNLRQDLEDELEFKEAYEITAQENFNLKKELKILQEQHDQIYLPWSCELCTLINQPYIETHRDICDVCEAPSPLKRATLTQ